MLLWYHLLWYTVLEYLSSSLPIAHFKVHLPQASFWKSRKWTGVDYQENPGTVVWRQEWWQCCSSCKLSKRLKKKLLSQRIIRTAKRSGSQVKTVFKDRENNSGKCCQHLKEDFRKLCGMSTGISWRSKCKKIHLLPMQGEIRDTGCCKTGHCLSVVLSVSREVFFTYNYYLR